MLSENSLLNSVMVLLEILSEVPIRIQQGISAWEKWSAHFTPPHSSKVPHGALGSVSIDDTKTIFIQNRVIIQEWKQSYPT